MLNVFTAFPNVIDGPEIVSALVQFCFSLIIWITAYPASTMTGYFGDICEWDVSTLCKNCIRTVLHFMLWQFSASLHCLSKDLKFSNNKIGTAKTVALLVSGHFRAPQLTLWTPSALLLMANIQVMSLPYETLLSTAAMLLADLS